MANLNWYLKTADSKGNRAIYTIVKYSKKPEGFKYYSGLTISPTAKIDVAGKKGQKLLNIKQGPDYEKYSKLLDFRKAFDSAFAATYPDDPEPEFLKLKLDDCKDGLVAAKSTKKADPAKNFYLLFETISKNDRPNTKKNYMAVMERLRLKYPDFKLFKPDEYSEWLKEENSSIKTTTINAYLAIIKEAVKEAVKQRILKTNPFEDFKNAKTYPGDKDAVALTKTELKILVDWKKANGKLLPELTNALQQTLDWFLIGCFTGLRSADLKNLTVKKNIVGTNLKIKTSKTGEMFSMPTPIVVRRIIDKYGDFPKALSSAQFNVNIKKVCQLAGLDETGVLDTNPSAPLYGCIQAHSARRTFITVALYEDKVPAATLRKWTLHKTESMIWAYAKPRVKDSDIVAVDRDKQWI